MKETKIEISLNEIEAMREDTEGLRQENMDLKSKLHNVAKDRLVEKAISLAEKVFNEFVNTSIKNLTDGSAVGQFSGRFDHINRIEDMMKAGGFYGRDDICVDVVATLRSDGFDGAIMSVLLNMGVDRKMFNKKALKSLLDD